MSDLISRKSALTEIRKDGKWLEEQGVTSMTTHERELRDTFILREMSSAQSVDAVEVVRCKDCKHRFNGEHHDNCCDVLMEKVKWAFEVTVEPDWFCADGKLGRKEN